MSDLVVLDGVRKSFGACVALDGVSLNLPAGHIVGLVGRNGSGKTTLLRMVSGLALPTAGTVKVFGHHSDQLEDEDLLRLGVVHQQGHFLSWMRVREQLDYVSSFYPGWDKHLVRQLLGALELDENARVGTLSPGNLQKLAVIIALGHRPELLLLDEPVSALDPLAREALLRVLLELIQDEGITIVISSHALRDVERVVDWIVCLDSGRVLIDAALDDLREQFGEWRVSSSNGSLPRRFDESFVLEQQQDGRQATLIVRAPGEPLAAFEARHHVRVEASPLNLERMFPLWTKGAR